MEQNVIQTSLLRDGWWIFPVSHRAHRILEAKPGLWQHTVCGRLALIPLTANSDHARCLRCLQLQDRYLPFDETEH